MKRVGILGFIEFDITLYRDERKFHITEFGGSLAQFTEEVERCLGRALYKYTIPGFYNGECCFGGFEFKWSSHAAKLLLITDFRMIWLTNGLDIHQ
jgi:hypothetical protein